MLDEEVLTLVGSDLRSGDFKPYEAEVITNASTGEKEGEGRGDPHGLWCSRWTPPLRRGTRGRSCDRES